MKFFVLVFFGFFLLLHVLILLNLPSSIPDINIFPFIEVIRAHDPVVLQPLANFDGTHYILISQNGYSQFQQAYFPLFPLLISLLTPLFAGNYLLAGLFISWMCFLLGIFYFLKFVFFLVSREQARWSLVFLLTFPTAFFYLALYPESLFLFVSSAALYYLYKKQYLFASVFAILASLTKIQGVFLLIPFLAAFFYPFLSRHSFTRLNDLFLFTKKNYRLLFFALSPLYGLVLYSLYLFFQYNDPFYYYHAQEAFGANRSSEGLVLLPQVLFRYFKIFSTASVNFQYWIAVLETSLFLLVFGVLIYTLWVNRRNKKDYHLLSLNLFSLTVLILPTLTGTLSSLPRYALISYGFFIALANVKYLPLKIIIIIVFVVLQTTLFIYFLKGYFVS